MPSNIKIYKNVVLGKKANIGYFSVIGLPAEGTKDGDHLTKIGDEALIRSHSVIYAGNSIGYHFQTGHGVLIREGNVIGDNVSIGSHTIIEHHVTIGNNVRIHGNTFIPEFSVLEDDCWIGPGVVMTNAKYPRSKNVKLSLQGPTIGKKAIIGASSVILPGIHIGSNALIGAGAVVVKDVKNGEVIVGNKNKIINNISLIEEYSI